MIPNDLSRSHYSEKIPLQYQGVGVAAGKGLTVCRMRAMMGVCPGLVHRCLPVAGLLYG